MPKLAVDGPFDERHLNDEIRSDPMSMEARQTFGPRERRRRNLDCVEPGAKRQEQLRIESRTELARKDEVVAIEIADEQRAEADASALRIGESADDQLLRRLALHLEP